MSFQQPNNDEDVGMSSTYGKWTAAAVAILLLILLPTQFGFWRRLEPGHPVIWSVSLLAVALSVVAVVALLRRRVWAPWPTFCSLTWTATIVAWHHDTVGLSTFELVIVVAAFLLAILLPARKPMELSPTMRAYYLSVAALTTYVAFWGLLFPNGTGVSSRFLAENFDGSLPFNVAVPTLHARMIGSLYLAATVVCLLSACAKTWTEARLGTWMILLWTGSLLGITLTHSKFFDWNKPSVWFWFVAYIGFPAVAAWLLLHGLKKPEANEPRQLSNAAVAFLSIQGLGLAMLAAILQLSPPTAAQIWPWAILPLLSRFYSAPLVTFGLSSLVASRCRSWTEIRALAIALAVGSFALAVASVNHRDKFDLHRPAAWAWFGGLAVICIGNALVAARSRWPARNANQLTS